MKLWVYRVCFLAFALIIIYLTIWVSVPSLGGVHFQIDASNVSVNNTQIIGSPPSNITVTIIDGYVIFAKVGLQNIPTLINGITTSTSIIVAFTGGVIAYMLRELFQTDRKAKIAFFGVFVSFIYILTSAKASRAAHGASVRSPRSPSPLTAQSSSVRNGMKG